MYPAQANGKSRGEQSNYLLEGESTIQAKYANSIKEGGKSLTISPAELVILREKLLEGKYKPSPVLRVECLC